MTAERLLVIGLLVSIAVVVGFSWWLTRPIPPRRGGYVDLTRRRR